MTPSPVVEMGEHEVVVLFPGDEEPRVRVPRDSCEARPLAGILSDVLGHPDLEAGLSIDLCLRPPLVQTRTLEDMPPVGARDLHRLVSNQRNRYFRPVPGEAVISADWVPSGEKAIARVALAPLDLLERLEEATAAAGRSIRRLVPLDARGAPWPAFETPRSQRKSRRRRMRILSVVLAAPSIALLVGAGAYASDLYGRSRTTELELSELREPLDRMSVLRNRLATFAPVAEAVQRQSGDSEWVVRSLAGLVGALPPHTHVHQLSMNRGGRIQIEAHGSDAFATVELLDAWWDGTVRLLAPPEPDSSADGSSVERYTVVLERAADE